MYHCYLREYLCFTCKLWFFFCFNFWNFLEVFSVLNPVPMAPLHLIFDPHWPWYGAVWKAFIRLVFPHPVSEQTDIQRLPQCFWVLEEVTHAAHAVHGDSTCLHLSSRLPSPGREATVLARPEKSSPAQLWRVWGCGGQQTGFGKNKINKLWKQKNKKQ